MADNSEIEFIARLHSDVTSAVRTIEPSLARWLVSEYYKHQDNRIRAMNQERAMKKAGEPHEIVAFLGKQMLTIENQIKKLLDEWSSTQPLGRWAKSVVGIGPVISAGLLAHIDMERATTAGKIWAYAGLDPTRKWEKGQKRPYNADLKVITVFKAGESFVKFQNHPDCFYGKLFRHRRDNEGLKNQEVREITGSMLLTEMAPEGHDIAVSVTKGLRTGFAKIDGENHEAFGFPTPDIGTRWFIGGYSKQASKALAEKRIGKDTDAYKAYTQGKLPDAHLHARARRYAVKLFLAHYHEQGYRLVLDKEPPNPYPIDHLGHTDRIAVPS